MHLNERELGLYVYTMANQLLHVHCALFNLNTLEILKFDDCILCVCESGPEFNVKKKRRKENRFNELNYGLFVIRFTYTTLCAVFFYHLFNNLTNFLKI